MIPIGAISVGATHSTIEAALSWALDIANDDRHSYVLGASHGSEGMHYDCSSFVSWALIHAGIDVPVSTTFYMKENFEPFGFEWIDWSRIGGVQNLERGDILLDIDKHVEFYYGNNQILGAHRPATGISVSNYYNNVNGVSWDGVLRYKNEPEISYSINLNDGDYIKGTDFPITGNVSYGGKYPWLHLYVDYGWVADTANNSDGNYAFYLDTTKYSDGEHLIGVKITNEDGLDFTTWRKVYIDNSKPNISNIYLSQVSDSSFRVCVVANDNVAIDHVRVATWTKSDQSDLIWHDCYFNGSGTYFIDLRRSDYNQGATQYYNHAYVYDCSGNYDVKVVTMTFEDSYSLVSAVYYSQIGRESFRICCQVRDNDDISQVRVATWATGNMSDIKWQDCYYNGYGTYFMDLQRSDYLIGAKRYISHLYVYDKNGGCESFEKSIVYDDNAPIISDITISEKTSKGFQISCRIEDESPIKSVQFPTWHSDNNQKDLIWYNAEIIDNVATCYIPISNHNNAYGTYFIHIYAYDYFDNLGTGRAAVTINPPLIGDTNLDGIISISDVTAIQRHLAELTRFTDEQIALADTNSDGNIDITDATHLQKYLAEFDGIVLGKS